MAEERTEYEAENNEYEAENPQVTPDESFLWASGVIRESQNKDSYPQELIGTAHIVVQLYFMSMQVNLLNRLIANVDAEDEPSNEG